MPNRRLRSSLFQDQSFCLSFTRAYSWASGLALALLEGVLEGSIVHPIILFLM